MRRANLWVAVSVAIGFVVRFVRVDIQGFEPHASLAADIIQGTAIGAALGFFTAQILAKLWTRTINGWTTLVGSTDATNGMLFRAACTLVFPGPVNLPQEAMYWTTRHDGTGRALDGRRAYLLRFPAGGLPPNDAFWSLTLGDSKNAFVANPLNRYSVSDRPGLAANADGSVDIYLQSSAPAGHETNWLPAPAGKFILWLRVYLPRGAALDGTYTVPPVVRVQ